MEYEIDQPEAIIPPSVILPATLSIGAEPDIEPEDERSVELDDEGSGMTYLVLF